MANYNANSTPSDQSKAEEKRAQKAAESKAALDILKASNANKKGNDIKKANAKARLQEVLKRIQQLKLNFNGDPKILARMLGELAKELKQIVKEYGSALGNDTPSSTNYTNIAANNAQANAADATAANDAQANIDTTAQDVAETAAPDENVANPESAVTDDKNEQQNHDNDNAKSILSPKEQDDFAKMARKALEDLKTLFKIAKAAVKFTYNDKDGDEIIKDFEDDAKDAENELGNIENSPPANSGSLVSLVA